MRKYLTAYHSFSFIFTFIHHYGTEKFSAQSGSKGVEQAKAIDPDVILIDISMAEDNALKISSVIKKDKALQLVPILFIIFQGLQEKMRKNRSEEEEDEMLSITSE